MMRIKSTFGTIDCPVCGKPIGYDEMGMGPHLRNHVRRGEITQEEKVVMTKKMFGEEAKEGE